MASKKKESEGISLLSMYGEDEDDDMDSDKDSNNNDNNTLELLDNNEETKFGADEAVNMEVDNDNEDDDDDLNCANHDTGVDSANDIGVSPCLPPVAQKVTGADPSKTRKGTLTIVDYGHDEAALSPEAEDGEIIVTGRVMFGAELETINGTPPGTVQVLTPSTQLSPQSSEHVDQSQSEAMKYKENEPEPEEVANISEDGMKEMDPLDKFLPPPPNTKCSDELQEKIIKFLLLKKKTGRSYNSEVRNRKEYRNPDFLLHAVTYQDIDQIGSCFSKDVFDPHGYDKSDYYDEIEADLKRELERKEQEKKKNQKIDFLSGGTQPTVSIPTSKMMPMPPVASIAGGGSNSVSAAADTGTREGRPNKKSKWDKVDGNRRHPLTTSGQDSVSSVGSNAALLSSSNAGSGYTAFAQQRRREAEERKSSDRKLDRRS
uniref:kinesin-related protein 4 n=1 Tax=Erigeron canadensis TaxID=72917 RepID=UPI001CB9C1E7|nr:kinesin-related protein 4 [Erigeron canadensis]XP_043612156.1 kinesin-related protein 4 [Erigeron canadensis]XP_043612157.1 kinesin-related protein 4 [Erigeron canadensis]